jgi:hypothetical protein
MYVYVQGGGGGGGGGGAVLFFSYVEASVLDCGIYAFRVVCIRNCDVQFSAPHESVGVQIGSVLHAEHYGP